MDYRFVVFWLILVSSGALDSQSIATANGIKWRVENPFRYFSDLKHVDLHRSTYESLSIFEKLNPILSAERRLGVAHPRGWASDIIKHVCNGTASPSGGCDMRKNSIKPRHHMVIATLDNGENLSGNCVWQIRAARKNSRKYNKTLTAPCAAPVQFKAPFPGGVKLSVHFDDRLLKEIKLKVKDIFVVGMGDSFASGEGNPDVPISFSRQRTAAYGQPSNGIMLTGYPARVGSWRQIGDAQFGKTGARWVNQACHRSLYSHQLRTALQLSLEDPHRSVTYADFACAGAEITKGVFRLDKGNEWSPNRPSLSQLSAVADAQCGIRRATDRDYPHAYHLKGAVPYLSDIVLKKCPRKRARKIDLLLLSIGGNDAGFSRLVANAVLADETLLRKLGGWMGLVYGSKEAGVNLAQLKYRYKALNRALHSLLHIPWNQSDRIVLTAYPLLALLDDGKSLCPNGKAGMGVLEAFSLNRDKAGDAEKLAKRLDLEMAGAAQRHGWSFAFKHRNRFAGHSICAGHIGDNSNRANDLRFPKHQNGSWQPYNPADYQPYVSRRRWFRTPNDAYLTGHFHVRRTLARKLLNNEKLRWFQLLLASTYSGAFHPTAEGQAVIADEVANVARRVLKQYRQ